MKIFFSHSSKQKLFVKELRKYLPYHLNLWIDEREILIGADLDSTIKAGIDVACDYFVVVIDHFAIRSDWVLKEIKWAVAKEAELGRVFLLPIVLEIDAWKELQNDEIKNRKYLSCLDFSDACIESLAKSFSSEILGWLCAEFETKRHPPDESSRGHLALISEAEGFLGLLDNEVKSIVHPHRRSNALPTEQLFAELRKNSAFSSISDSEFGDILTRLQKQGGLKGVYLDGQKVYLQRETFLFKADIYSVMKKKIAERGFALIEPEMTICIDGGSTTLELARLVAHSLKLNDLYGLKIVTNSLTAVQALLETLGGLNLRDFDNLCNIYMLGGRVRPISFTVVPEIGDRPAPEEATISHVLREFGGADVSFLGTNGVAENVGFAVHNSHELKAKVDMVNNSKRNVILADPSKFVVKQERVFARFDHGLTIITSDDGPHRENIEAFATQLQGTSSQLIIV